MAVIFKQTTTRPSLDDVFCFEIEWAPHLSITNTPRDIFDNFHLAGEEPPETPAGWVGYNVENLITWEELASRKNELRADLLELFTDEIIQENIGKGKWVAWNPFSTTHVMTWTFDTVENFNSANRFMNLRYGDITEKIIFNLSNLKEYDNTYIAELTENGLSIDNSVEKLFKVPSSLRGDPTKIQAPQIEWI